MKTTTILTCIKSLAGNALLTLSLGVSQYSNAAPTDNTNAAPLQIQAQGSFAIGGTVLKHPGSFDAMQPALPAGQTLHGDHARVFYQIPMYARKYPLVMWHGFGEFSKTWESTPDGREGYQTIFLRRRFPVYLLDQPRRGGAARSTVGMTINAVPDEQRWFNQFRLGNWPDFFPRCAVLTRPTGAGTILPSDGS